VLLRDINMTIRPGQLVLLLGGSGAGKTTLINAITGYEPAKAKVLNGGVDVYENYGKMKYDIAVVPQQDLLRETDRVYNTLDNAAELRMPVSFTRAEKEKRVEEVLDEFGLQAQRNSLVRSLSGGQRKRLSIACEFIGNPSLFILDEPDSGLDGVIARELIERLRRIADSGKIVIVITHTPDRVVDLFDHIIVLGKDSQKTGRLVFYGTIEHAREFFGKEKMEDIVKAINTKEEGGEGRADALIEKYQKEQKNGGNDNA
jgi:ABC-type multidrug transport system ATPase subunit